MLGIDLEFIEDESTLISHPIPFLKEQGKIYIFFNKLNKTIFFFL